MKVFSLRRYREWCERTGHCYYGWAEYCDQQQVCGDGFVNGTDGAFYGSCPDWEEEI